MRRIDFYIQHLLRHNAHEVELRSGKPVRFGFPSGDRMSSTPIQHDQISQLVQEAAPLAAMAAFRREGKMTFEYSGAGLLCTVRVESREPTAWQVVLTPKRVERSTPGPDSPVLRGITPPPMDPEEASQFVVTRDSTSDAFEPLLERTPSSPLLSPKPVSPDTFETVIKQPREKKSVPPPRVEAVSGEPAFNRLLREMIRLGASDLHLSSKVAPMVRLDGEMHEIEGRPPFHPQELERMMEEIVPPRNKAEFESVWDTDFAYTIETLARFRVNYFQDRKGPGAVFRQIPFKIRQPHELGLPEGVLDLCWLTKGLVLVTGPTGSGKSTTLATLVDYINDNRNDHIVTIEDPIEFVHENKKCLVNQREIGVHTKSFKSALRAALREDPDIVLVGEMRDLETIAIAVETAETGHLVFGTLHTTSAKSTVDRVIDQFPPEQQEQIRVMLAESLRGVIAQVLCKKKGGGRVAAYEILITNPAVSNLIREGKTFQLTSVMQTGKGVGMQTMNDHLIELVRQNLIEAEEAYVKSNDKQLMRELLKRHNIPLDM
jgi:twitching motility protein PilT